MSRENVEIVRRGLEAWNRRDLDTALENIAPDVEIDWSASLGPQKGIYRGSDAKRFWEEWLDLFDEMVIQPDELIDVGEHVVVPNHTFLRGRDGVSVEAQSAHVYTLRDGEVVRLRLYQEKKDALEAVGLRE